MKHSTFLFTTSITLLVMGFVFILKLIPTGYHVGAIGICIFAIGIIALFIEKNKDYYD